MKYKLYFKLILLFGLTAGLYFSNFVQFIFDQVEDGSASSLNSRVNRTHHRSENSSFVLEQRRRLSLLKSACKSNKNLKYYGRDLKNIIIDRADGLTYCPIFKAASTSWYILLLELRKKKVESLKDVANLLNRSFTLIKNRNVSKASKGTKKFVVVRHPFERIVSCYRDKLENINKNYYYRVLGEKMVKKFRHLPEAYNSSEKERLLAEVRKLVACKKSNISTLLPKNPYANPPGPTFFEFIQYVVSTAIDDEHWRPYIQHCSMCEISYDYILKFDDLWKESNEFLNQLDLDSQVSLKWENRTPRNITTLTVVCSYMSQLTFELANLLKHKYRMDLLSFEYNSDEYLSCSKNHTHNKAFT